MARPVLSRPSTRLVPSGPAALWAGAPPVYARLTCAGALLVHRSFQFAEHDNWLNVGTLWFYLRFGRRKRSAGVPRRRQLSKNVARGGGLPVDLLPLSFPLLTSSAAGGGLRNSTCDYITAQRERLFIYFSIPIVKP